MIYARDFDGSLEPISGTGYIGDEEALIYGRTTMELTTQRFEMDPKVREWLDDHAHDHGDNIDYLSAHVWG
jgi:hypothetical protein